jgi:hypothetical protein
MQRFNKWRMKVCLVDPTLLEAVVTEPGDCVSGDQVESSTPGLIPIYQGHPTTEQYHAGTLSSIVQAIFSTLPHIFQLDARSLLLPNMLLNYRPPTQLNYQVLSH